MPAPGLGGTTPGEARQKQFAPQRS